MSSTRVTAMCFASMFRRTSSLIYVGRVQIDGGGGQHELKRVVVTLPVDRERADVGHHVLHLKREPVEQVIQVELGVRLLVVGGQEDKGIGHLVDERVDLLAQLLQLGTRRGFGPPPRRTQPGVRRAGPPRATPGRCRCRSTDTAGVCSGSLHGMVRRPGRRSLGSDIREVLLCFRFPYIPPTGHNSPGR